VPADPVAQEVQLALAPLQQALASVQLLDTPPDGLAETLDFLPEVGRLKILADVWPPVPGTQFPENRFPCPCTR